MSVIVKDMEMPKSCDLCNLKAWDIDDYVCPFSGVVALNIGRQNECPLVEIPEGARLIDGNKLYKEVKTKCNPYGKPSLEFKSGTRVMDMIVKARTIYEEESE